MEVEKEEKRSGGARIEAEEVKARENWRLERKESEWVRTEEL